MMLVMARLPNCDYDASLCATPSAAADGDEVKRRGENAARDLYGD
jgi:hypothetical protein